ncbi:Na+/H+ antiporter NhaA [Mangrovibacterium marinum]|uniref:Na(+)/H(+) antiporter NhaA n=1 Tax=Mangrovibacterium marinum TaxID=1639118 RepID=A0A2T5C5V0_9BACT|nr:Na+/H+ antiporter NhaA [Mangrovibacterium marinum]PTN10263.1 sodium/proton antiporter (NhaA family) [Mangrovibacterium marinum]
MKFIAEPFNRFFKQESSSSILLLAVTLLTLIFVNVGFYDQYFTLLHQKLTFGISSFVLSKSLILWINDGLMAIFFFVIGLEIKREVMIGELSTVRKASLPVFAAVGGMLFPVIIYLTLNNSPETHQGWAIPMATDIAFTLGIMKLLGKRVPYGLKIFLTAFAIVDDLGAILVIALFYSSSIQLSLILSALALFACLLVLTHFGLFNKYFYFIVSVIIWVLFLKSGIHATLAGVLVAFAIPIRKNIKITHFQDKMHDALGEFKTISNKLHSKYTLTNDQMAAVDQMDDLTEQVQSPLQYLEKRLHGWVAFVIMPIFAFANAGVRINAESFANMDLSLIIAVSLILGNVIGISLFSFLAIKLKMASLPENTSFKQLAITGLLGGVGFTMSLFITNLAFESNSYIDASKIGILLGSLIAGIGGYFLLKSTIK